MPSEEALLQEPSEEVSRKERTTKKKRSTATTSKAPRPPSSTTATNAPSQPPNTNSNKNQNAVEQLQLLRDFLDVSGDGASYTERELMDCYRKCDFNVHRAAEQLLLRGGAGGSGTTDPTLASPPETIVLSDDDDDDDNNEEGKFGSKTIGGPRAGKPKSAAQSLATKNRQAQRKPPPKATSSRTAPTPPPAAKPNIKPVSLTSPSSSSASSGNDWYILCDRWISDGCCTIRNGSVSYQEPLQFSTLGNQCVRFQSKHMQGRLPDALSHCLAPLLQGFAPCIRIQGRALMELQNAPMGSHIPLSLQIQVQPRLLFRVFDANKDSTKLATLSSSKGKTKEITTNEGWMKCLYQLFQWAEYGDMSFLVSVEPSDTQEVDNTKKKPATTKQVSAKQTQVSEKVTKSQMASRTSLGQGKDANDCENETESEQELLAEEDFEEGTNDDGTNATSQDADCDEVKDDVDVPTSDWAQSLPEEDDPQSWNKEGGVALRPYQRQALHWMLQREQHGCSRKEWEEQLEWVTQLSEQRYTGTSSSSSTSRLQQPGSSQDENTPDIVCDCGPVLVSDRAKEQSRTMNGDINPISHPLWKQRFLASLDMQHTLSFYVNEVYQIATHQPPAPPTPCSGGILADSMGMGKTVMLLALILKSMELKEEKQVQHEQQKVDRGQVDTPISNGDANLMTPSAATLVVAKLSLLPQWEEEIKTKTNLSYLVYYGTTANATKLNRSSLEGIDIVLTTYGTIQGERTRSDPILLQHHFERVILDEAHCIKNSKTLASQVCCQIQAQHRWCVSGTIFQNSLDDIYGMVKFLRHEPWCHASFWKTVITKPSEQTAAESQQVSGSSSQKEPTKTNNEGLQVALDRVRRLLAPLMLRRTKNSLSADGKPILTLPPIETRIVSVVLSDREREFYNAVLAKSVQVFDGFVQAGTVHKSYFQIFSLLQRLRQVCDHISLTVRSRLVLQDDAPPGDTDSDALPNEAAATLPDETENDVLGKQFLEGLLSQFCHASSSASFSSKRRTDRNRYGPEESESPTKRHKENYLSQVANTLADAVRTNMTQVDEECPICLEQPKIEDAVLAPCAHIFCRSCLVNYLRGRKNETLGQPKSIQSMLQCPDGGCPCCNKPIEASRIIALSKSEDGVTSHFLTEMKKPAARPQPDLSQQSDTVAKDDALARQVLREALDQEPSSKMTAIFQELDNVWNLDPGSKVLIFSHYLGFLDLLERRMRREGIAYYRLDGSLSLTQRMKVLDEFRSSSTSKIACETARTRPSDAPPDVKQVIRGTVLLMSMSAGGEGLNLTAASTCFLTSPWWHVEKENQCLNRIHRIGQMAPQVRVRRFVVADSVEERIVELQQRKSYMADEIYSKEGQHDASAPGGSRLSLEEFRHLFHSK